MDQLKMEAPGAETGSPSLRRGRIAVSAIFTGRLWPPAQRRPVKHTETEKALGVQIAVSAIFTGRLWPPAQRRPVKHTETEKAPRVEARDAL